MNGKTAHSEATPIRGLVQSTLSLRTCLAWNIRSSPFNRAQHWSPLFLPFRGAFLSWRFSGFGRRLGGLRWLWLRWLLLDFLFWAGASGCRTRNATASAAVTEFAARREGGFYRGEGDI